MSNQTGPVTADQITTALAADAEIHPATQHTPASSAANSELVATMPAVAGEANHVTGILVGFSAAPASPVLLTIESPSGSVHGRMRVPSGMAIAFPTPMRFGVGAEVVLRVAAAGVGVSIDASLHGFTA